MAKDDSLRVSSMTIDADAEQLKTEDETMGRLIRLHKKFDRKVELKCGQERLRISCFDQTRRKMGDAS